MATVLDVAKRARVSPMTVSRVVNGSGPVSPTLRARVEKALKETGYVPNTVARNLRTKRTDTIGLVMPDITNPFFTHVVRGMEVTARESGLYLLLTNTDQRPDEEQRVVSMLLQRQVDGMLAIPAGTCADTVRRCRDARVPLVIVDRRPEMADVDVVRADAEGGAYELGQLLAGLGHRHAAVLTGPEYVPTAVDRAAGFAKAYEEAGLPAPIVRHGDFSLEAGRDMCTQVMQAEPRPTAIFAGNNFLAIGTQHALEELGLRIPEDVALVGLDDLPTEMVTFPFLTVAAQPAEEMGRRAVRLLLERIKEPDGEPQEILLPTELIVRRSSGDPVGAAA
ncbi:MAG: LacI family DNA-binding transcriptional regulator [Chloroflexota bacterium]|jgi:LacI family transcriptional regulator